jgi:hypothetical protein
MITITWANIDCVWMPIGTNNGHHTAMKYLYTTLFTRVLARTPSHNVVMPIWTSNLPGSSQSRIRVSPREKKPSCNSHSSAHT